MPHEIRRVLRAFAAQPWFIEPRMADRIVALLEYRATHGPRTRGDCEPSTAQNGDPPPAQPQQTDGVVMMPMHGIVTPRGLGVADICEVPPASIALIEFQRKFRALSDDPNVRAIVLDWDSPGGLIDLVPETAAMIRAARREDRPIVSVANTLAASAAYWIASAADELVVTPSGEVGSIGVYMLHQDVSLALEQMGVKMTFIKEGPRKTEGNPFEPLGEEALAHLQETCAYYYGLFVRDVAKAMGVKPVVVRADPEKTEQHFGGGRCYPAETAVQLGMAHRVDTLQRVVEKLRGGGRRGAPRRRAATMRRRLELI